ncbi:MAG: ABC transporter permease [Gemmatimonadetes bacterium]|nr:ABC transporter permease [Gemmatimonadota bacterium]
MRDLRYALRSLSKSPGFVLVATLCLGLALALNTTTFAILDAMLHPSLPVRDADRLFTVTMWGRQAANDAPTWERYEVLRAGKFYEDIGFFDWERMEVRAGDDVGEQWVSSVSSNLYPLLGVEPEQGRLLDPGSPQDAAVVSHDFWERWLNGRSLDGLTLWVGEREYRVMGVFPSAMTFPGGDVVIPVPPTAERTGAGLRRLIPVVRIKRGWTPEAVSAHLAILARRLTLEYGTGPVPYAFSARPITPTPEQLRQIHFAMAGAAFLVLLIACANLANLMLVRGVAKHRELALRMALGAGRATVARQLLVESALIAAAGALLGLLLTLWATPVLGNQMPPSVRELGIVRPLPSWRVFVAGLGAAVGALVLFGLWPAVRASNVAVSEPLKDASASTTTRRRWRYSPVVVAEVSLSLVLLMGAALLTKAAGRLSESTLGFDREGLLQAWVWLGRGMVRADSAERISRDLLARVGALPEVRSVAAMACGGGSRSVMSEFYDGSNGLLARTSFGPVSDSFLRTLGIPVLQGRDFLPGDERARAVIVDETVAAALWPDRRAVGQLIKLSGPNANTPWWRVVGVARRAFTGGPEGDPYLPTQGAVYQAWQPDSRVYGWGLAIRTREPRLDGRAAVALRQAIRDALPGGRALWVRPWLSDFDHAVRARYFLTKVFAAFSGFALTLATIGLYGVVSYGVSQRMREFAVRIAVGAPSRDVMKLVAHDGAVMILAGTGIGAFLAMWGSTLLGDWLYNVYHTDAVALVIAEAVLLLAGFAACLQPALRAMRANPVEILRAI